eukprot:jgi/Bigna1/130956/aug1.12_g5664
MKRWLSSGTMLHAANGGGVYDNLNKENVENMRHKKIRNKANRIDRIIVNEKQKKSIAPTLATDFKHILTINDKEDNNSCTVEKDGFVSIDYEIVFYIFRDIIILPGRSKFSSSSSSLLQLSSPFSKAAFVAATPRSLKYTPSKKRRQAWCEEDVKVLLSAVEAHRGHSNVWTRILASHGAKFRRAVNNRVLADKWKSLVKKGVVEPLYTVAYYERARERKKKQCEKQISDQSSSLLPYFCVSDARLQ